MYTGNLFKSTRLQENIVESTGPVLSFTVQVPQGAVRAGEPVTQPGEHCRLTTTSQTASYMYLVVSRYFEFVTMIIISASMSVLIPQACLCVVIMGVA